MSSAMLVPRLRFPEFETEWESKLLQNLFQFKQGVQVPVEDQFTIREKGMVRFIRIVDITQPDEPIRYISNLGSEHIVNHDDLFMIRYGTPGVVSIGYSGVVANNLFRLIWKRNNVFFSKYWYFVLLRMEQKIFNLSGSSSMPAISFKTLNHLEVSFPELPEQQKIADFLTAVDKRISQLEEKKRLLTEYKKGVMQQIFSQQIRFKDDNGNPYPDWQEKRLGEMCSITTGKLDANAMVKGGKYRFYTCAKDYFWIDKYHFDTEALLISGNGANVGYIHYYKGKFNAYQRTYVLDAFSEAITFIKYMLEKDLRQRIYAEKKEGNTPYIVLGTLSDMKMLMPSDKNEQQKIADFLTSIDNKIEQVGAQLAQAKGFKQGLLQQMFV